LIKTKSYELIQAILDVLLPKLRTFQKEGNAMTDPVRGGQAESVPEDRQLKVEIWLCSGHQLII
jgi:hypothetical protein